MYVEAASWHRQCCEVQQVGLPAQQACIMPHSKAAAAVYDEFMRR